ncbi:flagellar motor switch protein FliG [Rhizobium sp. Root274]|uniref:flagellar motor switch protein FliG n=1 Tax=unclassified Rhizobium TaxID=2613769 RepID=UPI0007130CF4|nr:MULTISPECIES: flagellar motor switch protein FliG [unclassified Rhizobium]KQW26383.1 flagellar motor switch protein FliG [Rhizobium sp. Root1240]KRD26356.1 flagellar motor switch protein FliG [Rhizobium sp. Root274]
MALAFDDFSHSLSDKPLTQADKAAAIMLAMGKETAGRLLKYFTQSELQTIIASAQKLRTIPPHELDHLVAEFEALFTAGAGLMDNAKVIESILEDGLTPDEVDELLGRRAAFQAYQASVWERLKDADPRAIGRMLLREHPQTAAYILSMLPSSFGAKVLMELSESRRADIMHRAINLKGVSPKAALIVEKRLDQLFAEIDVERNSAGSRKVAEMMNELDKEVVDTLLQSLEIINKDAAERVRPQIFLFDDILIMPQRSRSLLLNDISSDILTLALRGASSALKECVLSSISPRTRRMVESELQSGVIGFKPRDIAVARRSVAQEAIRMAASGQIQLKEGDEGSAAA